MFLFPIQEKKAKRRTSCTCTSPMKPQRTFVFCKSQKNVSTGIASTVITPTKWFLPRLYSNFVCNELISLSGNFIFVALFLTHNHCLSSHLGNGSSNDLLSWSTGLTAYYSAPLNIYDISTSHIDLEDSLNHNSYLNFPQHTHEAPRTRLSTRGRQTTFD